MVYDNLKPIPIPEDAYVNTNDGRVFVYCEILDENDQKKPKVIGYTTKENKTKMVTNSYFRDFYPLLWRQYFPEEPEKQYELNIGLYAIVLSIIRDSVGNGHMTILFKANRIWE